MSQRVPYIGRKEEIKQVISTIHEGESPRKIICVSGPGGIGKTRFLEEVHRQLLKMPLRVGQIIDFDAQALSIHENLERTIASQLDENAFAPYFQQLQDFRKLEGTQASEAEKKEAKEQAEQSFIKCFNDLAAGKRIVLLFDTLDDALNREMWMRLTQLIGSVENVIILLAGRNGESLYDELLSEFGEDVSHIKIESLDEDSATHYLTKKQEILNVNIEPSIAKKILVLAGGRPILIDLATEWLSRDLPDQWLATSDFNEIQEHQDQFEANLVRRIVQIRRPVDRLSLLLSHVFPLDSDMASYLLNLSKNETEQLFNSVMVKVYIKSLPDGRITLHDEMRRMINAYVWQEVDPTGERRERDSRLSAEYLREEIKKKEDRLFHEDPEERPDGLDTLHTFIFHEELRQEIWALRAQLLKHVLYTDQTGGMQLFTTLFDKATSEYRLSERDDFLEQIEPYRMLLPSEAAYEVSKREVQDLLDRREYGAARQKAQEILADDELLQSVGRVDMLIQLANAEIRQGHIEKAIAHFHEAVEASRRQDDEGLLIRSLNGLGWAYRNQGSFSEALERYLQALSLTDQVGDRYESARILNNMSYVSAYKGDQRASLEFCREALEIWKELGTTREEGMSHSTLGEIYRRFGQWTDAMKSYEQALGIFEDQDDREWISTVKVGQASVWVQTDELDNALVCLEYARKFAPSNLLPRIIHTQAQVFQHVNDIDKAYELFQDCYIRSSNIGSQEYMLKSFADLLDIAWERAEFHRWRDFREQIKSLFAERSGEESFRLEGSSLRKVADLAICAGSFGPALDDYKRGLPLIAKYEVHSPYVIAAQLATSYKRIRQHVDSETIKKLGEELENHWIAEGLDIEAPEARRIFIKWKQKGGIDG
jgi:tetratricopeptide (TPR) repeat protein